MSFDTQTNEQIFKVWASKSNQSVDDLNSEYKEKWDKSLNDFPQMVETERRKYILSLIQTSLKRQLASPAKKYVAYFIAATEPQDAHRFDADEAKKSGRVNVDGLPVWKGHKYFKDGEVITERMQAKCFGIASLDVEGQPREWKPVILYNDYNPALIPPLFTFVNFRANGKEPGERGFSLTTSSVTDFKTVESKVDVKPLDVIKQHFKNNCCNTFAELKEFNPIDRGAPNNLIIIKGVVGDIRFRDGESAILEIGSLDEDLDLSETNPNIAAFVPMHIPINFGVNSTIYAIGVMNQKRTNMSVCGIIEGMVTKKPENIQTLTMENSSPKVSEAPKPTEDNFF